MVVKWDQARIKVIPKNDGIGSVILAPGYNEVEDANWNKARWSVMKQIQDGVIVEEWTKISPEQAENFALLIKDGNVLMAPAKLKDINRPRVITEVVKQTYHIPTLERWLDEELRMDVRLAIMKQLIEVDKMNPENRKMQLAAAMDRIK
jgi:hypothetical protein